MRCKRPRGEAARLHVTIWGTIYRDFLRLCTFLNLETDQHLTCMPVQVRCWCMRGIYRKVEKKEKRHMQSLRVQNVHQNTGELCERSPFKTPIRMFLETKHREFLRFVSTQQVWSVSAVSYGRLLSLTPHHFSARSAEGVFLSCEVTDMNLHMQEVKQ